jgi:long-subunit acyl-CoA synthetase (AMP-forming)
MDAPTLKISKKETLSAADLSTYTLIYHFLKWEAEIPDQIFLSQPLNRKYTEYTWKEVGVECRKILVGLQAMGYKPGDKIAILSSNCAQWIISDLAIMLGGFVSVPLYANVNAETMSAILKHSESKCLFVGKLAEKDWNQLKNFIPGNIDAISMNGYERSTLTSFDQFKGDPEKAKIQFVEPDDVLTIIYTSGTTGMPKGVVHTNNSILQAIQAAEKVVYLDKPKNRFISYLPLSHAAERGLIEGGCIYSGGTIGFVETQESFIEDVKHAAPTHFFGVPRIWEKIQSNILVKLPQKRLNLLLSIPIVSALIKKKIKKSLGLDNAIIILSGAAPISKEMLLWYQKLGITIQEAYGMTENFNVLSINPAGKVRPGTVGCYYKNIEVKIDPESKEILQKCEWQRKEYYKEPDLTKETIENGWLHTGDQGFEDDEGYLTIIGRVKDIFKTSKGEYITPGPIEAHFMDLQLIDQACVLGTMYSQPFSIVSCVKSGSL